MVDTTVNVLGMRMQYTTAVTISVAMAIVFALCVSLVFRINRIRKEAKLYGFSLRKHWFVTKGVRRLLIAIIVIDTIALWQFSVRIFYGPRLLYGAAVSGHQMATVAEWAWAVTLLITILGSALAWTARPDMRSYAHNH